MKSKLTQKDLKFGIYWGTKGSLNPGLNVWCFGRFIWPLTRQHGKRQSSKQQELPLES